MNNKGFTMIELLGVIVIIGILAGLAIPAVTKYIGKTRDRAYDNIYESAYAAAQGKYMNDLDEDGAQYSLKDLYGGGYMDEPIDPSTRKFCDGTVDVEEIEDEDLDGEVDLEVSEFKYKVTLECTGNKCREYYTGKDSKKNGSPCS